MTNRYAASIDEIKKDVLCAAGNKKGAAAEYIAEHIAKALNTANALKFPVWTSPGKGVAAAAIRLSATIFDATAALPFTSKESRARFTYSLAIELVARGYEMPGA